MPSPTVPEDSDLRKCPRCSTSWNRIASGDGCCPCLVESKPAIPLTQSEIDLMLADSKQANELLRERVAELEKVLRPLVACAKSIEALYAGMEFRIWPQYGDDEGTGIYASYIVEAASVLGLGGAK